MDSLCPDYAITVAPYVKFDLSANDSTAEIESLIPVGKMRMGQLNNADLAVLDMSNSVEPGSSFA
jgi:hypothetical protein